MFDNPLKWLRRNWWGLIVAYLLLFVSTYLLIWQFAEPLGIPDTIETMPAFAKSRIFLHLTLTFLIAPYLTLILDLIIRFQDSQNTIFPNHRKGLLERIGFGSTDTPILSCWHVPPDVTPKPDFKVFNDGFQGKVLQVRSTSPYNADYKVRFKANEGKLVEFVIRLDDSSARLYARFMALSKDGTGSKKVWLNFKVEIDKPALVWENESECEWVYPITPTYLDGDWLRVQVNLNKAAAETVGDDGWKFGRLEKFRLRKNLSLSCISVYAR